MYLTGSEYANDYLYVLEWTGANGTANIYLPDTNPNNLVGRDSNGYHRELRFVGGNSINANDKVDVYASGSDLIDGLSPNPVRINKIGEGVTFYSHESGSWLVMQRTE